MYGAKKEREESLFVGEEQPLIETPEKEDRVNFFL
jgi:hypothetical protein